MCSSVVEVIEESENSQVWTPVCFTFQLVCKQGYVKDNASSARTQKKEWAGRTHRLGGLHLMGMVNPSMYLI